MWWEAVGSRLDNSDATIEKWVRDKERDRQHPREIALNAIEYFP
jgi:hypothetical protein